MNAPPPVTSYDWLLVNSSAGKDSQAALDLVCKLAEWKGVLDRVVVVHCDLGRVEWQGTRELAERQAAHYGVRFETVQRPQGDLLEQVYQRQEALIRKGKEAPPWPSPTERWCTSDQKRGQVRTLMTRLANEFHGNERGRVRRACRILNIMGMRAEESSKRAKMQPFAHDKKSSSGRRHVDTWLPIHDWSTQDVWLRIRDAGTPYHRAYDLGMSRLSCVLCIFAPRAQLMLAAEHNRALLDAYVEVERDVGYTFKKDLALADIAAALDGGERATPGDDDGRWNM